MQRVSMPSDLAATSPLLLQLLIPQGFTLQSRSAQTQSQTQAPWLQRDPLLSHLPLPKVQASGPAMFPYSSPWLQEQPPTISLFFFLITTNSRVKSQTVALLSQLCVLGPVTVWEKPACWGPYTYEGESILTDINIPHLLFLSIISLYFLLSLLLSFFY